MVSIFLSYISKKSVDSSLYIFWLGLSEEKISLALTFLVVKFNCLKTSCVLTFLTYRFYFLLNLTIFFFTYFFFGMFYSTWFVNHGPFKFGSKDGTFLYLFTESSLFKRSLLSFLNLTFKCKFCFFQ